MCLVSLTKDPFIVQRPIECYKVFKIGNIGINNVPTLFSPFTNCSLDTLVKYRTDTNDDSFDIGTILSQRELTIRSIHDPKPALECNNLFHKGTYTIDRGYLHAYLTRHVETVSPCILVRCLIPEGTKCYISEDLTEVCAEEMIMFATLKSVSVTDHLYYTLTSVFKDPFFSYAETFLDPFEPEEYGHAVAASILEIKNSRIYGLFTVKIKENNSWKFEYLCSRKSRDNNITSQIALTRNNILLERYRSDKTIYCYSRELTDNEKTKLGSLCV